MEIIKNKACVVITKDCEDVYVGFIIYENDNKIFMMDKKYYNREYRTNSLDSSKCVIFYKKEDAIMYLISNTENKITSIKGEMESTRRNDYSKEMLEKENELTRRIKKVASNIVESTVETFEQNLKEICQLKKQYYSMECDQVVVARKNNNVLREKITQLKSLLKVNTMNINKYYEEVDGMLSNLKVEK